MSVKRPPAPKNVYTDYLIYSRFSGEGVFGAVNVTHFNRKPFPTFPTFPILGL